MGGLKDCLNLCRGGQVNIRDVLMACAIKDNISNGARIALVNTMALLDREREQVRFTELKAAFKQTFQPPPPQILFMGKTLVGTMITTIRNEGVAPVPRTALQAGTGTSSHGTSPRTGPGRTVPTLQDLGKTTGQVPHSLASTLVAPLRQIFCWITGHSTAVWVRIPLKKWGVI